MATVFKRGRSYAVQFADLTGERRTLAVGRITKEQARLIGGHLEALVAARRAGVAPPPATAAWLGTICAKLRAKLAKLGLVDAQGQAPTLGQYLADWLERKRIGFKPASLLVWQQSIRDLTALLGDKPLTQLTHEDGERFRRAMLERGLRPTTVHKRLQHVRAMLEDAVRLNILDKNPWRYVRHKSGDQSERPAYVPWDAAERLLDVCPDRFRRLAIVLRL